MEPLDLVRPRRPITGMSAVLLPWTAAGEVDWPAFDAHVVRTAAAGLVPAVNMDTGFVHLLDPATRAAVVARTASLLGTGVAGAGGAGGPGGGGRGRDTFVAGAFVDDAPGAPVDVDAYVRTAVAIAEAGGTPIVFPSYGSAGHEVEVGRAVGARVDRFLAFELGSMFAPFGRILDLAAFEELLRIPACAGAKHSSLSRDLEWERLRLRDAVRPEFLVLTGNDLAIDMVVYGSDYLLGISTFAPDLFAERDRLWEKGDSGFHELNDALQALSAFAFRDPVPAYRHDAALFLQLRGWLAPASGVHRRAPVRPHEEAELDALRAFGRRLGVVP